jgi:hypothetical protein
MLSAFGTYFFQGLSKPQGPPEGLGKLKKFIHLIGSPAATFQLVAKCRNDYATASTTRNILIFQK